MRWGDYRRSENVEDRTGNAPEGGGGGLPFGGMRLGGGALIILVIVGMLFGINPFEMLGMLGGGDGGSIQVPPTQTAPPGYGPQAPATQPPGAPAAGDVVAPRPGAVVAHGAAAAEADVVAVRARRRGGGRGPL